MASWVTYAADGVAKTLGLVGPPGEGIETLKTVLSSGAAQTIDFSLGSVWDVTLDANCAITLSSPPAGKAYTLTVLLHQDLTGGRTVTWPGSVVWLGGVAPVLHSGAATFDVITLFTLDGGTTWYGAQAVSPAPSFASAVVLTGESTSSPTYTDLTTVGPQVTVTVGPSGILLVGFGAQISVGSSNSQMSLALSGANTLAASADWSLISTANTALWGRTHCFTGLTPGSTTVTAKYLSASGSSTFLRREVWAQAI